MSDAQQLLESPGPDDERGTSTDEELDADEAALIEAVTEATESVPLGGGTDRTISRREQELLAAMEEIAERSRHVPDYKTLRLIDWIRENLCPGLPPFGQRATGAPTGWAPRRVLIFTESREGTKRYLRSILEQAIAETERADERIEVITGLTSGALRKEIQRRFNTDPAKDPLRILIATDAAREGLNFQAHCSDLFHFDLPWNPGRIEQRNGRVDRKLQPAAEVRCHYFVLPQRAEDHVLDVLVRKTETIRRELGSLSKVIDDEIERRLSRGIRHRDAAMLAAEIERADLDAERKRVTDEELEQARERQQELRDQIDRCRGLLERSRTWVGFQPEPFRNALSCSLELLGADPLRETTDELGRPVWRFPSRDRPEPPALAGPPGRPCQRTLAGARSIALDHVAERHHILWRGSHPKPPNCSGRSDAGTRRAGRGPQERIRARRMASTGVGQRGRDVSEPGLRAHRRVPVRPTDLRDLCRLLGSMGRSGRQPIWTALNSRPKYVASTTLTDPQWADTTVLSGDVAATVADLKAKPGGELQVHGSGNLVRWMLANDLVDEITLLVCPVVIGQGTRLFPATGPDAALDLVDSRSTPKGITIQVYWPTGRPQYETATTPST